MRGKQKNRWIVLSLAAAAVGMARMSFADTPLVSFTPGDLVVLRGGDTNHDDSASGAYSKGQVPVYLDEYTSAGTYVGTVNISSVSGAQDELTLPGQGVLQHEGALNLSPDGQYLTFAGYNADPSTSTPANITASVGKRVGIIGAQASSLNTSTVVNAYGGNSSTPYLRSAVTVDGKEFWTFGKFPNGGLQYVSGTGASATSTPIEPYADWRNGIIVDGQLYGGTGSSSVGTHGAYQISTGLPTSTLSGDTTMDNTLLTDYAGGQSASNLAFANVPTSDVNAGTQNGVNVLYTVGDQNTASIVKYFYNSTTKMWEPTSSFVTLNATNVNVPTGLAVNIDPTNPAWVDIYVSGTNGIYSYIDKSGDPTTALPDAAFTQIVTPTAGESFYGLQYSPVAVPEPTSLGLLALGALAMMRRNRR